MRSSTGGCTVDPTAEHARQFSVRASWLVLKKDSVVFNENGTYASSVSPFSERSLSPAYSCVEGKRAGSFRLVSLVCSSGCTALADVFVFDSSLAFGDVPATEMGPESKGGTKNSYSVHDLNSLFVDSALSAAHIHTQ